MPVSRMRMRPWLESKINSSSISGLQWVNKDEKMFSIPWKHAARHGWEVDKDASLFKEWAIHTGKFKEGHTNPDPKTWKANFRCAMNSLPDIEEVKDKSINKGSGAVRVYRMMPAISKKKDKRSKSHRRMKPQSSRVKVEEMNIDETPTKMTQEHVIDSTDSLNTASPVGYEVEIGPDSTCDDTYISKFQVSPLHVPELEDSEAILELTRQLERDGMQWMQNNCFGKVFLGNEVGTTESLSQESQWSVSSAGEELELRLYTELNPDMRNNALSTYTEMWNSSSMPQTMCPL